MVGSGTCVNRARSIGRDGTPGIDIVCRLKVMTEVTRGVWPEQAVLAAEKLYPPEPWLSGRAAQELDEAVSALRTGNASDVAAARARIAARPSNPLEQRGLVAQAVRTQDRFSPSLLLPPFNFLQWPAGYFIPGNSKELWLGISSCSPDHRYASASTSPGDSANQADPATGHLFSFAEAPAATDRRVSTAGVFIFVSPAKALSVLTLAPELSWAYTTRWKADVDFARNYAYNVRLGGDIVLNAWIWNEATRMWERATNGLGGTPVGVINGLFNYVYIGAGEEPAAQVTGHVDSGQFTVPVLVEAGNLYALGVHVRSWYSIHLTPANEVIPPPNPHTQSFKAWGYVTADVSDIWVHGLG
jgi:hypothetical protein